MKQVITSYKDRYKRITLDVIRKYGIKESLNITISEYKYTNLSTDDVVVYGFLRINPFKERHYNVFITKDFNTSFRYFIKHELAHIIQNLEGRLTVDGDLFECWDGERIDFSIPYEDREHEIDANNKVREYEKANRGCIGRFINKLLGND